MPLYEYRCEACGKPEEKLESLSAPEVHACPLCGAPEGMKRQLSVAAFSLAGGGWYKGAASEPAPSASTTEAPKAEAPKAGHGCAAGGCGCPLAG
jgi:putative FmdB family regulatory protein